MDLESFLATARRLLAVPSTADRPDDLRRALDLVIDFVLESGASGKSGSSGTGGSGGTGGAGLTVERFESNGKPSALVYPGPRRPHFRIILNAHLDVVPAPAHQFRPRLDGTRLHARGAQDMKVSALVQAQVFRELAGGLPYPIALQLVTDEEVGGRDGTLHQLEQGVSGDFVVIGEQSGLRVVTDSKGMVTANLRATGRSAHSAYQWLGDNALLKLQRSLDNVLARYPVATEEAWRTTVTVARIETPNQARNQVPALAEAWLDIRFPAGDPDLDGRTAEEIAAHLVTFCEPGVIPVVEHVDPPHHADRNRPEVRGLQRAARNQGYHDGFLRKHGAADGRFYYQRGIDAVIFGIGGDGQHGPDEYADTTTIVPYYRALSEFLRNPGQG
ncbi:M20 family metallopeptidase [Streptosporangium sp. NPDC051023]|uniref:M20 family metallopeptidase n=1 Tax=Streptosporangium sp. NPDC051023 TaxID=3155410 RepID=UPI00344C6148